MKRSFNTVLQKFFTQTTQGYLPKSKVDRSFLRIDMGESALGVSPQAVRFLKEGRINISRYPEEEIALLQKDLAKSFKVDTKNILIGSGSDSLIAIIAQACANPGDHAVVIVPTFYRFLENSRLAGLSVEKVRLNHSSMFEFSDDVIKNVITVTKKTKTTIVWLCNPNNPTGNFLPLPSIEKIAQSLPDTFVVVDEVFFEFLDGTNKKSAVTLLKKFPNIIVLRSFSKTYGLAGIRCGFAISSPEVIRYLQAIPSPFAVSGVSLAVARIALSDRVHLKKVISQTAKLRQEFIADLESLSNMELGSKSRTNILLLRHKSKDLFLELQEYGIFAADFRNIEGLEGLKFVRVTIRTQKENKKVLNALQKIN